jgi:Secretion system C-terminal sorting domain
VGYTILFPSNAIASSGVTSTTSDVTWSIQPGDPAGTYTVQLEAGIGSSPTVSQFTKNGGAFPSAFFTVTTPGLHNFQINGFNPGNNGNGVINLYKCGVGNTVPVTNNSTRASFIGKYRFTVFNSTVGGAVGSQVSQTAWLSAFPSTVTLPSVTGAYYVVRLESQNTCGTTSTAIKDAWVLWANGVAPIGFQVNQSSSNCSTSNTVNNNFNNAANPTLMRPFNGGTVAKVGNNYTQHRISIQECNASGTLLGSPVVNQKTFSNNVGEDLSPKNFGEMFNGLPVWMSGFANPWTNTNSTKTWRMTIEFFSVGCGWTGSLIHYFRINTACPNWFSLSDPNGGDFAEAQESAINRSNADVKSTMILAFPNPVSETLLLDVSSLRGLELQVELFDMTGRRTLSISPVLVTDDQLSLDVSNFIVGTYFYRCNAGGNQYHGKFVKI